MILDNTTKPIFAFFGTSRISVIVLDELKSKGYLPKLIITVPDKPKGRKMIMTPPETKIWAIKENIPFIQLDSLKKLENLETIKSFSKDGFDLFIVASYGKIIPQNILEIPRYKTLNVHPSLLPKLRGPSPIKSAILSENETGVTIIRLDEEMDHGPIISQKKIDINNWPPYEEELESILGKVGGEILVDIIPDWINGKIKETEQDHNEATFCQKIKKEDGEINLGDDVNKNLRKIRAYHNWPGAFYFLNLDDGSKKRIIVKTAHVNENKLIIERVIPEGKKEMSYEDFVRGLKKS